MSSLHPSFHFCEDVDKTASVCVCMCVCVCVCDCEYLYVEILLISLSLHAYSLFLPHPFLSLSLSHIAPFLSPSLPLTEERLENAFSFAEREISGIPCILTAEQCIRYPDEKSILTYVSFFYRKYKGVCVRLCVCVCVHVCDCLKVCSFFLLLSCICAIWICSNVQSFPFNYSHSYTYNRSLYRHSPATVHVSPFHSAEIHL